MARVHLPPIIRVQNTMARDPPQRFNKAHRLPHVPQSNRRAIKDPAREIEIMQKYMLHAIDLQKSQTPPDLPITALLLNPKVPEILLVERDTRVSSGHPLRHAIMNLLNKLPTLLPGTRTSTDEEEQYYASMYDVYVTHEPCVMCCMALV